MHFNSMYTFQAQNMYQDILIWSCAKFWCLIMLMSFNIITIHTFEIVPSNVIQLSYSQQWWALEHRPVGYGVSSTDKQDVKVKCTISMHQLDLKISKYVLTFPLMQQTIRNESQVISREPLNTEILICQRSNTFIWVDCTQVNLTNNNKKQKWVV